MLLTILVYYSEKMSECVSKWSTTKCIHTGEVYGEEIPCMALKLSASQKVIFRWAVNKTSNGGKMYYIQKIGTHLSYF
jgi:hypothetical protein